ncbi:MAG: amino acid permease [Clostridia bacterium]|nr:amino acid permease [Clostridia bacterium]
MSSEHKPTTQLSKTLPSFGVWAFAVGTSIGWGSLVITNNTYLAQAGPLGSVLGMIIGAVIMLIISRNFAYLMNAYPEAGGAYTYSKEVFGYDHGFLTAWFLTLTYLAMLWANATSLPLFARYFLGDTFAFGKLYTVFGYDVYIGEALLSIAGILLFAFLCARFKKIIAHCMIGMVIIFMLGILVCVVSGLLKKDVAMTPAFASGGSELLQIAKIACISPWAFIGFESALHGVEEFSFKRTRIFRILVVTVLTVTILYIAIFLLSVTAYPPEYASWSEYIKDLPNQKGIEALPAFYAARHYLGSFGVTALMISLLALVFTSLIGTITALSRLFYALGKDGILPGSFHSVNRHDAPGKAVLLIAALSVFVPFLGRTAVGWIVDVTMLGAVLVYGFVSASALKLAKNCGDRKETVTGAIGLVICVGFAAYLLFLNLFTEGSMETESFFLFIAWAMLGFLYFRFILKRDLEKRFGKSVIVWIALLSLVVFVSLVWMSRSIMEAATKGLTNIETYYTTEGSMLEAAVVAAQTSMIRSVCARSIVVVVLVFALSFMIMVNNYNLMSKRATRSEMQLGRVRSLAFTDPLTGVKSKLAYSEKERELNEKIKSGELAPFALTICDVNGLKQVNDTLGHKAGDAYLKSAAHTICELFDHSPVYRIGGDEFLVLLLGQDYENRASIMQVLHEKSVASIGTAEPVISAGMSVYSPGEAADMHAIFEQADANMYKEKQMLRQMGAVMRV